MTYQPIDIGTTENDGTGDTLRAAMQKVNDNTAELFSRSDDYADELSSAVSASGVLADALNLGRTAIEITEDTGTITPTIYKNVVTVTGSEYTFTVIAKANGRDWINLYSNQSGGNFYVQFDLANGVLVNTINGDNASIKKIGDGWFACSVTKTVTGAGGSVNLQIRLSSAQSQNNYTGDGSSVFIQSAVLLKDGVTEFTVTDAFDGSWTESDVSTSPASVIYKIDGLGTEYFHGKKWAALGTSITAQNKYVPPLALLLGATAQNLGVSGASLASGAHYGSLGIYNKITDIDVDTSLVTLEAGINDFGTDNSTLGSLGDTTTATFYGALYAAGVAIKTQAPNAEIVFITPYGGHSTHATHRNFRTNSNGETLFEYQKAVKEVAGQLGIACIDAGSITDIGYLTADQWTSDGLHLSSEGGVKYAQAVYYELCQITGHLNY